jgi:hypothetical protein
MREIAVGPSSDVTMAVSGSVQRERPTVVEAAGSSLPLTALADTALQPSIEQAVDAVREFLGMDIAYATEIVGSEHHLRVLQGDGESFHASQGMSMPADQTYCDRVLAGRLPNIIPDVNEEPRAAGLPITAAADIGAFTSVPLTFSDGRVYGTLCTASHAAKPSLGYQELQFLHVFARMIVDQIEREEIKDTVRSLELQAAVAQALVASVGARDAYTGEHSEAVVAQAAAIARYLGLSDEEVADVKQVALLHDIGKIAIPDAILQKRGPLTDEEWKIMCTHPISSEQLIRKVPGLAHLAPAIRGEHERWDGRGYPDGLAGDHIPLASRITFVCDAYNAMTTDRPYRHALPAAQAQAEIRDGIATQFCPTAANALLQLLTDP